MALRCQTRLSEVALCYASAYPRDCSMSRHPSKCSFDSQNCSWAAQNKFMRKKQLLLNHICQFNNSPRHTACMLREQQNQVKPGTKAQDWEFSTSYVSVSYWCPTCTMNVCARFPSENCCSADPVDLNWLDIVSENSKQQEKQGKIRGVCTVSALAVLSPFTCTFKKSIATSYYLCVRKCIFYLMRIFWSRKKNLKSFLE